MLSAHANSLALVAGLSCCGMMLCEPRKLMLPKPRVYVAFLKFRVPFWGSFVCHTDPAFGGS